MKTLDEYEQMSSDIVELTQQLNSAITTASRHGLTVAIDAIDISTPSTPDTQIFKATCSLPLPLVVDPIQRAHQKHGQ